MDDVIPDGATIAHCRSKLDEHTMRELLDVFNDRLTARRYVARDGRMIDALFALVPILRHTRVENASIKQDETPAEWEEDAAMAKLRQKDLDAR